MCPPGQVAVVGSTALPPGAKKCAINECQKPCFIDESGTVHECCGITHAMEHQRRKAIEQRKSTYHSKMYLVSLIVGFLLYTACYFHTEQQVIKGVTHCLLPECNQLVWPFKNYCGRSHADIGAQRGLARKKEM